MLETIKGLPSGVEGVRANGRVTGEDYRRVMEPLLDDARRAGRRVRFVYEFAPEFEGFAPSGVWEDAHLGLRHMRLFEGCAIVTDVEWLREAARLFGALIPCPSRVFQNGEMPQALAWLASLGAAGTLTHRFFTETGVILVEPHGPLRATDFDALAAVVDPWIEAHGDLHGLVIHARSFPGWADFASLFRHVHFVRDHQRRIRRIALALDGAVAELGAHLGDHFVQAQVKRFDYDDLPAALAWAGEGQPMSA